MSKSSEIKTFLSTLDQPQNDIILLRQKLVETQKRLPDFFIDYVVNEGLEAIDTDSLNWNDGYFRRQKKYAEHNFSVIRLEHLLEVREHGRQKGWKGFLTQTRPVVEPWCSSDPVSGYRPSDILEKYIREKNMLGIRTALRMELFEMKLDSGTLRTALNWTKKQVPNLCEPYVEKDFCGPMDQSRDHWNKDYFFTQEVYLDTSFTEERFLHMIEVRELLCEHGVEGFVSKSPRSKPLPVISDKVSQPAQVKTANHTSSRAHEERMPPPHEHSNFIKKSLLIGGAIAALILLLLALRK